MHENGKVVRNKDRLFAQGYSQQEGIDYDEIFYRISILESIFVFYLHMHLSNG